MAERYYIKTGRYTVGVDYQSIRDRKTGEEVKFFIDKADTAKLYCDWLNTQEEDTQHHDHCI